MTHDDYSHFVETFERYASTRPGDPVRSELREQLILGHTPLAEHIASRFRNRGESVDDLTQIAMVGLIHAIDRFDPARGTTFLSFAIPTIMGEVRRYFRDSGWSMRVPRKLKELHASISQGIDALSQQLGRTPTPTELSRYLNIDLEEVHQGLEAGHAYKTTSLYQPTDSTESDRPFLAETLGQDDPSLANVAERKTVEPLLARLPYRQQQILLMRFFDGMTQREIASHVGVSQMHISRILSDTLEFIRKAANEGDDTRWSE